MTRISTSSLLSRYTTRYPARIIAVLDQVDGSDLALQAESGTITNDCALNAIAYRYNSLNDFKLNLRQPFLELFLYLLMGGYVAFSHIT